MGGPSPAITRDNTNGGPTRRGMQMRVVVVAHAHAVTVSPSIAFSTFSLISLVVIVLATLSCTLFIICFFTENAMPLPSYSTRHDATVSTIITLTDSPRRRRSVQNLAVMRTRTRGEIFTYNTW